MCLLVHLFKAHVVKQCSIESVTASLNTVTLCLPNYPSTTSILFFPDSSDPPQCHLLTVFLLCCSAWHTFHCVHFILRIFVEYLSCKMLEHCLDPLNGTLPPCVRFQHISNTLTHWLSFLPVCGQVLHILFCRTGSTYTSDFFILPSLCSIHLFSAQTLILLKPVCQFCHLIQGSTFSFTKKQCRLP